jgi:hypothetical protein
MPQCSLDGFLHRKQNSLGLYVNQDSSVSKVSDCGMDDWDLIPNRDHATSSRPAVGPTQPSVQWVQEVMVRV